MRPLQIITLIWVTVATGASAESQVDRLAATLERKWTVIQLSAMHDAGDYRSNGPYAMIQRLPNGRLLVSGSKSSNTKGHVPAPLRFVSEEQANAWIAKMMEVLEKAVLEESPYITTLRLPIAEQKEAQKDLKQHVWAALSIRAGTATSQAHVYTHFDETQPTVGHWHELIHSIIDPIK